ncbi:unnamed protein product [Arctogadus glacialis]
MWCITSAFPSKRASMADVGLRTKHRAGGKHREDTQINTTRKGRRQITYLLWLMVVGQGPVDVIGRRTADLRAAVKPLITRPPPELLFLPLQRYS